MSPGQSRRGNRTKDISRDTPQRLSTSQKHMIPFRELNLKISGFLQKLLDMTSEFGYNKCNGEF